MSTTETLTLAEGRSFSLEIEALESLEETIDELFLELERTGNPGLLEDLCPYFGCVWPAARALSRFLAENDIEEDGAVRVLEVGCGLAIPSLLLAKTLKFSKVIATDFHPEVPKFLEKNLAKNLISQERFEYRELNWRDPPANMGKFGIVIGSDILYEKSHPGDVAEALVRLVKPLGRILIADPLRPYLEPFIAEMIARGFTPKRYSYRVPNPPSEDKETVVLDFRKT